MDNANVEVIAGVNLPMLIKLATVRGEASLPEAIVQAQEAGRKYINVASRVLSGDDS
jgi:PTS system mannose-specific IIA component